MSNWCHNRLAVSGERSAIDQFFKENQKETGAGGIISLSFSQAVPEPKENTDIADWYSWRIYNWGTSSVLGAGDIQVTQREDADSGRKTITYTFSTLWAPPAVWLEKVALGYPDLIFCMTYGEAELDFGGSCIYKNGAICDSSEGKAVEYIAKGALEH